MQCLWNAYPHSHYHTFLTITLPCSLVQNKTRHRRAKPDSRAVATQHSCAFHIPCPHIQAGQTPVNHRKFRKFKTEHQHFQSQQVPVSPPHQQGMGPGEGKAEAARDLGSPSAEDEPRHTATSRCCVHSHSREQEFSPPWDFPAAPRNSR